MIPVQMVDSSDGTFIYSVFKDGRFYGVVFTREGDLYDKWNLKVKLFSMSTDGRQNVFSTYSDFVLTVKLLLPSRSLVSHNRLRSYIALRPVFYYFSKNIDLSSRLITPNSQAILMPKIGCLNLFSSLHLSDLYSNDSLLNIEDLWGCCSWMYF